MRVINLPLGPTEFPGDRLCTPQEVVLDAFRHAVLTSRADSNDAGPLEWHASVGKYCCSAHDTCNPCALVPGTVKKCMNDEICMKIADSLHFGSAKDPRGYVLDAIDGREWAEYCTRHEEEWSEFARDQADKDDRERWSVYHDGGYWGVWGSDYGIWADGVAPVPVIRGKSPPDPELPERSPEFFRSASKEELKNYVNLIEKIIRRSGGVEVVHPLRYKTLYLQLANADTPEKLLQFVDAHGMPFKVHDPLGIKEQVPWVPVQALEVWRDDIRQAIRFGEIDLWDEGHGAQIPITSFQAAGPNVTGGFVHDEEGRSRFRFQPITLTAAVWVQLGIDIEAGVRLKRCPHCRSVFGVGPNTYHRTKAIFCAPKCQNAAAYARRKAGAGK